jgi:hypothetical protein
MRSGVISALLQREMSVRALREVNAASSRVMAREGGR